MATATLWSNLKNCAYSKEKNIKVPISFIDILYKNNGKASEFLSYGENLSINSELKDFDHCILLQIESFRCG